MKNAEDMTVTCRAKSILLVALQKTVKPKFDKLQIKFPTQVRFKFEENVV